MPRGSRAALAAALLAVFVLSCLFGATASASAAAPGKPVAKSPRGNVTTNKPTFAWRRVTGATKYEVDVYQGSALVLKKTGLKGASWKTSKALPMSVNLTWNVRGSNARGAGAWSRSLTFKIVDPNAPQGAIGSTKPTFTWAKVARAKKYELRVFQGSKLLIKTVGLKKPSWRCTKALPMYTNLTWKVRGTIGRRARAWSKSYGFKILWPAAEIAASAGDAQTAVAGAAVTTAPSVVVKDANNVPVAGVSVSFAVASGGGSIAGASATTDVNGVATAGSWTLGTTAGVNTLTASSTGLTGSPVTFRATGTAGAPVRIVLSTGNFQAAVVGTAVATCPSVIVTDANGNPVAGASVTFTVASGGGSVTGASVVTDANGVATVGSWTLGAAAGVNTLTACIAGVSGPQVTFAATGAPAPVTAAQSTLTPTSASITADGSATQVLTVQAKDVNNNNLTSGGATVTITRSSGTGTIGPVTDNGNGTYTATVAAPTAAGSGVFVATLDGAPVKNGSASQTQATVSYVAGPGSASRSTVTAAPGSITADGSTTSTITVTLYDANNNPVSDKTVTLAKSSGPGNPTISAASGASSASGVVTFIVKSTTAGADGFQATDATDAAIITQTASVTFTAGAASVLRIETAADGSGSQIGARSVTAGASFSGYAVTRDAYGNFVANPSVTWSLTGITGGVVSGDLAPSSGAASTFSGHLVGSAVVHAVSGSLTADSGTVTVNAGAASKLALSGLSTQTAGVAQTLTVTAQDAFNNTASGYTGSVHFTSSDGAAVLPANYTFLVGDAGVHSFASGVTLKTAGSRSVTGTDTVTGSINGSQSVTVNAGAASVLRIETAADGSGSQIGARSVTAGASFSGYAVTRDAYGNFVANPSATWSLTGITGGVVSGDLAPSSGAASTFSGHLVGSAVVHAVSGGLTADSGTVTVNAGAASKLALSGLSTQTAGVAQTLTVTAQDAFNNTASGYTGSVHFTSSDGAAVLPANYTFLVGDAGVHSFASGVTLKTAGSRSVTGTDTVTGSINGSQSVTVNAGAASVLRIETAADGSGSQIGARSVTAGASFSGYAVTRDAYGNFVANPSVTWSLTGITGGVVSGDLAPSSGAASTFSGHLVGSAVVHAVSGSLTADSGTVTVNAGAASKLALSGLSTQTAGVAQTLTVTAQDAFNNTASGYTGSVHFTSSDGAAVLPANYTFLVGDAGVHSFASGVTLKTAGSRSVTGTDTVTGSINGSQTVTVNAGAATQIAVNAGNNQVAAPGTSVATAPSVIVRDAYGNPVSGVSVTFAIAGGGGSVTGPSATTNGSGVATVGSWTLGAGTGANTMTATSTPGLTGSPLTFTATAITIGTPYGGGVVGYILKSGDPGYDPALVHGLIVATVDQGTGPWALAAYQSSIVNGTSTALGTGSTNTALVIAQNSPGSGYAAGLAQAYSGGGYTDWYLPSRDELNQIYANRVAIGLTFAAGYYWTSSEGDAWDAWQQHFGNGSQADYVKSVTATVRAVRSF